MKRRKPYSFEQAAPSVRKLRQAKPTSRDKLLSPTLPTDNVPIKHKCASGCAGEKEPTLGAIRSTDAVNWDLDGSEKEQDKENVIDPDSRPGKSEKATLLASIKQPCVPTGEDCCGYTSAVETSGIDIIIRNKNVACASRNENSDIATQQDKPEAASFNAADIIAEDTTFCAIDSDANISTVNEKITPTDIPIPTVKLCSDGPGASRYAKGKILYPKCYPDDKYGAQTRGVLSEQMFDGESNDSSCVEKQEGSTREETPNDVGDAKISETTQEDLVEGRSVDGGTDISPRPASQTPRGSSTAKGAGGARGVVPDTGSTICRVNDTADVMKGDSDRNMCGSDLTTDSLSETGDGTLKGSRNFKDDNGLREKTHKDECSEYVR